MKKLALTVGLISMATLGWSQGMDKGAVSSFPNYHPLIVHFPIILLLLAAVMQVSCLFFKNKAYNYTVVALTFGGFVTGLLATTVFHAHAAESIPAYQMEVFETHEKFAMFTLWLSGIASVVKIAGLFVKVRWVELLATILLLGSAVTVSIAGHHGAELVYKYGIGPEGNKLEQEH